MVIEYLEPLTVSLCYNSSQIRRILRLVSEEALRCIHTGAQEFFIMLNNAKFKLMILKKVTLQRISLTFS